MKSFICDVCKKEAKSPHGLIQPTGWGNVTVTGHATTPKYIRKTIQLDLCEKCFEKLPAPPNSDATIEDTLRDFVVSVIEDMR